MKYSIRMEIDDPFEYMEDLILQDFVSSGWSNWRINYPNENQLELFDIYKYQKYDRFGRLIDNNKPRRDVIIK